MDKKIDITSTAVEKGIDMAKDFLGKLIMPAVEETGLLIKDQVTRWRFNNQVRMLNKARAICEKNKINPKTISMKLLSPLLDYSCVEEDELLMNKWAILLSNLVDSEQNIENHVFPYILSQMSKNEFLAIESSYDKKKNEELQIGLQIQEHKINRPALEEELVKSIEIFKKQIADLSLSTGDHCSQFDEQTKKKSKLETQLRSSQDRERYLRAKLGVAIEIPPMQLKDFELSNLIRLGLVKEVKEFYANTHSIELPMHTAMKFTPSRVDLDIDLDSNTDNVLTQLGILFLSACKEKKQYS